MSTASLEANASDEINAGALEMPAVFVNAIQYSVGPQLARLAFGESIGQNVQFRVAVVMTVAEAHGMIRNLAAMLEAPPPGQPLQSSSRPL